MKGGENNWGRDIHARPYARHSLCVIQLNS